LTEIPAESEGMAAAAPSYTTACGMLKQPDKQKLAKPTTKLSLLSRVHLEPLM